MLLNLLRIAWYRSAGSHRHRLRTVGPSTYLCRRCGEVFDDD